MVSSSWYHFWCVGGDFPHQAIIGLSAGCHTIYPNSNTIYPELASDSTGWGLSPTRLPSFTQNFKKTSHNPEVLICASDRLEAPTTLSNSGYQFQAKVVTHTSDQLAINERFPCFPPWVQLICWNDSQNSEKQVKTYILKSMSSAK